MLRIKGCTKIVKEKVIYNAWCIVLAKQSTSLSGVDATGSKTYNSRDLGKVRPIHAILIKCNSTTDSHEYQYFSKPVGAIFPASHRRYSIYEIKNKAWLIL